MRGHAGGGRGERCDPALVVAGSFPVRDERNSGARSDAPGGPVRTAVPKRPLWGRSGGERPHEAGETGEQWPCAPLSAC